MKSMLIIDVSQAGAQSIADLFEKRGWLVVMCRDPHDAMRRLAGAEPYDVVLLGHQPSEDDTVKTVRFIRALEYRITTAIVVLNSSGEIDEQARQAGADEVLPTPVDPNALISTVEGQIE